MDHKTKTLLEVFMIRIRYKIKPNIAHQQCWFVRNGGIKAIFMIRTGRSHFSKTI